jgi:Fe2+ transport system protein FeoA
MMPKVEVSPMSPEARIEALRNAPRNGWAAFSENEERLVAYGMTYDEVVRKSKENGVAEPVVVKVPDNWNDSVR